MASTRILLTNLTTGVSSPRTSTPPAVSPSSSLVSPSSRFSRPCQRLVDGTPQLFFVDQNRLNREVRLKLDLIKGPGIRGISDADIKPVATFEQGQGAVGVDQLFVNDLDRRLGQIKRRDVENGDAEFCRVCSRHMRRSDKPLFEEIDVDRLLLLAGLFHSAPGVGLWKVPVNH
jgi:hypothetical protein